MITLAMMKPLGSLLKRLDVRAIAEKIKLLDAEKLFTHSEAADAQAAKEAETAKLGELIFIELANKLEVVADDLVTLLAAYKGVTTEEAQRLDLFTTLKELFAEEGLKDFFGSVARTVLQK